MLKESIIQQQICEYLSISNIFFFSIPNEHYNINYKQLASLKKMGMVPGMPDLCILKNNKAIFLEVKSEAGQLSEKQKIIHDRLKFIGYDVFVVRGVYDVVELIRNGKI